MNSKIMRASSVWAWLIAFVALLFAQPLLASEAADFHLSPEEIQWLARHPEVRVGIMYAWPPLNYVKWQDNPAGIGVEYIKALNKRLNHVLTIVPGKFSDNFDGVKNKTLDALMDITPEKEREPFFHFTIPYITIPHVIVGRIQGPYFSSEADLAGKTVALERGFYNIAYFRNNYPTVRIKEYDSTSLALDAVSRGEADAYAGNRAVVIYLIEHELITNLQVQGRMERAPAALTIGVRKDWPELASMLNRALASLAPEEESRIRKKWLSLYGSSIALSSQEKAWLRQNPVISVHTQQDGAPFTFNENGKAKGFAIDYMNVVAEKLGFMVDYHTGSWDSLLETAKDDRLDVMLNVARSPEREAYLHFCDPYYRLLVSLFAREDVEKIRIVEDLYGKRVAVPKGSYMEILVKKHPQIQIVPVQNTEEAVIAVSLGNAEALLNMVSVVNYYIRKLSINNLRPEGDVGLSDGSPLPLHIAVNKNNPVLASLINKAMEAIDEHEVERLQSKWLGTRPIKDGSDIQLTAQEQAYLKKKGAIKMSVLPDWLPYEWINNEGRHEGIGQEMIQLIASRVNIPIELVPTTEWGQSLQNLRNRTCDILPIAMNVPSRTKSMNFTRPYIIEPFVIATRADELFVKDVRAIGNRQVGITRDYAFAELFESLYPDLRIVNVANARDGLIKVRRGELFGYIDALPSIAYTMQTFSMLDLKIAGKFDHDLELCIASRSDEPLLGAIMQKAVDSITEEERSNMMAKWLSIRFEQGFNYALLWKILTAFALLFAVVLFWTRHLAVMNRKIRQANLKAEAASRAKSEFLANMSHEIRTPLNAVTGFSELLSSQVTDEKHKSYIEAIKSSGKNLMMLINDVLDLSKIEAGRLDIQYSAVDLKDLLKEVEQVFALQVAQKGIRLITKIGQDLPQALLLDEVRIRQVLLNLVGNAIKFTERGCIWLSVEAFAKPDEPLYEVHICVEDSGIGIPENEIEFIFESFRQPSGQDRSRYGGTGLGLAICKRLVEMMNGRISVESTKGQGTIFKVIIHDVAEKSGEKKAARHRFDNADIQFGIRKKDVEAIDALTPEAVSNLPELIGILESEAKGQWDCFQTRQPMEAVKTFGTNMKELGTTFGIDALEKYGQRVTTHVDHFDVSGLQTALDEFPGILSRLKSIKENTK